MATTKPKGGRTVMQAAITLMVAGIQNDLPTGTKTFPFDGQSLTPAQVISQFQAWLTAVTNVATARVAYAHAVSTLKGLTPGAQALLLAMRAWVKAQFGSTNQQALANFGVPVKAKKVTTVATKAASEASRRSKQAAKAAAAAAAAGPTVALTVGANGVQYATPAAPTTAPTAAPAAGK